jgi:hypothetical protein
VGGGGVRVSGVAMEGTFLKVFVVLKAYIIGINCSK